MKREGMLYKGRMSCGHFIACYMILGNILSLSEPVSSTVKQDCCELAIFYVQCQIHKA